MSVWLTIPSKRPPEEAGPVLEKWRAQGYKIALLVDWNAPGQPLETRILKGDLMLRGGGQYRPTMGEALSDERYYYPDFNEYPGYARACNALIAEVMKRDESAEWFICAGDDTLPDPNHTAKEIAFDCGRHFGERQGIYRMEYVVASFPTLEQPSARMPWSTYGVMQPTGDRWGEDDPTNRNLWPNAPANIDRVAGSPWIGREFARRMYQGNGPYWHQYRHQFVDEELQAVAIKLGVFWQRRDLIQLHNHWGRPRKGERMGLAERMPEFLAEANSPEHWKKYKQIFENRRAAGFPGHEPIA